MGFSRQEYWSGLPQQIKQLSMNNFTHAPGGQGHGTAHLNQGNCTDSRGHGERMEPCCSPMFPFMLPFALPATLLHFVPPLSLQRSLHSNKSVMRLLLLHETIDSFIAGISPHPPCGQSGWAENSFSVKIFFFFFLCGPIFKVVIESVTILFQLYVLAFWPWGIWNLNSPNRDQTCNSCIRRPSTGWSGKSLNKHFWMEFNWVSGWRSKSRLTYTGYYI